MAQDRFGIYPATFIYAGPTTLHLKQIHDVSVDAGAKRERPIPGGALDAAATILNNADPMVHLKTKDLNSVFAAVSPSVGLA
ncbi:MAG TPA: hypothetical protein VGX76_05285, partial [Pirellulales bacterium]|nr:hypothetical protein [Pirellulales bacterium]